MHCPFLLIAMPDGAAGVVLPFGNKILVEVAGNGATPWNAKLLIQLTMFIVEGGNGDFIEKGQTDRPTD